jgi:uncharacterized MAPEG superfamily protein
MPTLLNMLGLSVVLLIVQIVLQATLSVLHHGLPYSVSARDGVAPPYSIMEGRATRALWNLLETYPAFVALALGLVLASRSNLHAENGACLWLGARVIYIPVYLAGIPYLRTFVWAASLVGLLMMLFPLMGWA